MLLFLTKKCCCFLSKHRQTTDQFKCGQAVNKNSKFRYRKQGLAVSVACLLHLLNKYCKMYLNQWWANVWNVVWFWDLCSERWQCWWRRIVWDTLIVRGRWAKKRKKNNFVLNYLIELIALNLLFTKNLIIQHKRYSDDVIIMTTSIHSNWNINNSSLTNKSTFSKNNGVT